MQMTIAEVTKAEIIDNCYFNPSKIKYNVPFSGCILHITVPKIAFLPYLWDPTNVLTLTPPLPKGFGSQATAAERYYRL